MSFFKRFFDVGEIKEDDNLFELGYVDSLFGRMLILFLEETYGIEVDEVDLDENVLSTIKNITSFVEKKLIER